MSNKKVCVVILINSEGLILGVSRKDNHSDFNLVGGKVDDTDETVESAIIREAKEETGLDIFDLNLVDERERYNNMIYCYRANYKGTICTDEPHIVKWLPTEVILQGSFKEYNEIVFKKLNII